MYSFSQRHIDSLSGRASADAQEALNLLKANFARRREDCYFQLVELFHQRFLKERGVAGREVVRASGSARSSVCWNCHLPVDNSINLECTGCRWIIFGCCGACDCRHEQVSNESRRVNSQLRGSPRVNSTTKVFPSFREVKKIAQDNLGSTITRLADDRGWQVKS